MKGVEFSAARTCPFFTRRQKVDALRADLDFPANSDPEASLKGPFFIGRNMEFGLNFGQNFVKFP